MSREKERCIEILEMSSNYTIIYAITILNYNVSFDLLRISIRQLLRIQIGIDLITVLLMKIVFLVFDGLHLFTL